MEKDIKDLSKEELTNPAFIPSIFENYTNETERDDILSTILSIASEKKVLSKVKKEIDKCKKEYKIINNNLINVLMMNPQGLPEPSCDNYIKILTEDEKINNAFFFDEFSNSVVKCIDGKYSSWTDKDDACLRSYIEKTYNIYHLQKYYDAFNSVLGERRIHPVKELIESSPWDGKHRIDKFLTNILGCKDDDYSREVSRMIFYGGINRLYNPGCKFDYMPIFIGSQGCVDCDTEFFNGTGWKKISEYVNGDMVLQYNDNGTAELVYPLAYIKQPSEMLYRLKTKYGIDMCLSDNHNVYYESAKGKSYMTKFRDIRETLKGKPFKGRFLTSFVYSGNGIDLSDAMIRLYVAVIADGSFYYQLKEHCNTYSRCRFHIKKERKKERLIKLLEDSGLPYMIKPSANEGYTDYYVDLPYRLKNYPAEWYNCTQEQLQVIAEEVMYWDGNANELNGFCTTSKSDADFIQFVYSATDRYASCSVQDRRGRIRTINGKEYVANSIDYCVNYSNENRKTLNCSKDNYTKPVEYKPIDGYEYCFTVPSHKLVLRRNNHIFITGNCGKSTVIRWLALRDEFSADITSIDGKDGVESLSGSWICEMAELLAMVRVKEIEAMKGFVSRTFDTFRPSYGRRVEKRPRTCIFIGTTNEDEFLLDMTGNRRYLPVNVNLKTGYIFEHEKYIKDYILSCWQEALVLMKENKTYLTIPIKYSNIVNEKQEMTVVDNPKVVQINEYLNDKEVGYKICAVEVFVKVYGGLKKNFDKKTSREIGRLLNSIKYLEKIDSTQRTDDYGVQRVWVKHGEIVDKTVDNFSDLD